MGTIESSPSCHRRPESSTFHRGAFRAHLDEKDASDEEREYEKTIRLRIPYRTSLASFTRLKGARDSPKEASGFSSLTVARWSWEKNMYAERGRLGALGSFFALVGFSPLSALLARGLVSLGIYERERREREASVG